MSGPLPEYFFRTRDNGCQVFRVGTGPRQQRIEMTLIATVNLARGEVRPHADTVLSVEDTAEIEAWIAERRALLELRQIDDINRTVDHLNKTALWAQSRASDEALEAVTDALLLAMHDLRSVLVRKKADRLTRDDA